MSLTTEESADETVDADALSVKIERAKARRRRGWKIAGALAAATLALLVGAYLVLDFVDRRAGEAAIERVREAGDPVTPQELAAFYKSSPEIEQATEHWNRAFRERAGWNATMRTLPILGSSSVQPQLDERGFYSQAEVAKIRPFLDGPASSTLHEIRLAREAGAVGRFAIALENVELEQFTEHFDDLRTLGRLLSLRREIRESEGDFDGAAETVLDLVAVSEAMRNEPFAISFLVRTGLVSVAAGDAMISMGRCPYDEPRLHAIQQALERQDLHADLLRVMRGEQATFLQSFDEVALDPGMERLRSLPFRGADRAKGVEWFQAYLKGGEGGWAELAQATDAAATTTQEIDQSGWIAYRYAMTVVRTPNPLLFQASAHRAQTNVNVAVACAACRRYRLAHGEWPESLETLVPDYLAAIPLDPIIVRPLAYERDGDAIRIRTSQFTKEAGVGKLPYLDQTGQHVFDAASFETAE